MRFLLSRIDYERTSAVPYGRRDFKLDRMRALLDALGNPQNGLKIVHIAGTKGKGSTAAMTAAMLCAAGYRTGVYSSPHLERVEERIAVDAVPCAADVFARLIERTRPAVERLDAEALAEGVGAAGPTYFEVVTAMALVHFADMMTDVAVLEVGLGGRLDSTNVAQASVSVITSISFDHMKQLGNTLAAIAGEKAGIIKPGVPVVSGVTQAEPRRVIEAVAEQHGSPLVQLGEDFDFTYTPPRHLEAEDSPGRIDLRYSRGSVERAWRDVELGLLGRHQAANAAVAVATLIQLERQGWRLSETAIRRGLRDVRWPARIELVSRRPCVVLDAAHNVASVEALLGAVEESFSARQKLLIFATTQDKDVTGMLRLLLPRFDQVIFTRYLNNPRAVAPEQLAACAAQLAATPCWVAADPQAAWQRAKARLQSDDLAVITGSFFTAAEMRAAMRAAPLIDATNG